MDEMNEALINGDVLRWARERQGIDVAGLAASMKVSETQILQWEENETHPPFGKAELLSEKLKIPFGYLFLSKHPEDVLTIKDFRTRQGEPPSAPSPALLAVIEKARTKQEWYREFCEENGDSPLSWIGAITESDSLKTSAEHVASLFSIDTSLRDECATPSSFLTRISERAQERGVLVMRSGIVSGSMKALRPDEFQGFALSDPYAPVAFVNSRDAYTAQVFTLVHEIVHLCVGESGVSLPDVPRGDRALSDLELFCNRVTAEILVPTDEFLERWTLAPRNLFAEKLSRSFNVSAMVIIRKAFDLGKIAPNEFFELVAREKSRGGAPKKKKKGGDPTRTLISRNSLRFTSGVLTALRENRLVYRDAASLLGIQMSGLESLIKKKVA